VADVVRIWDVSELSTWLYEDERGKSGVRDFLNRLKVPDRAKIDNKLNMIRLHGWDDAVAAGILKNFGGNIYEVVVKGTPFRLLGFRTEALSGQTLVLVEGFKKSIWKQRQKKQILQRTGRLREDWLRRHEGGGET
jgi:hypothetical protein